MESLNSVSETALITLRARVEESAKPTPLLNDPMGQKLLEKITTLSPPEVRDRLFKRRLPTTLTYYLTLRARKYDELTKAFIARTQGLVVSLGCGFDTRYWRVSDQPWQYVEVDLPEVIETKKALLGDQAKYEMIGCSVLENDWVSRVAAQQSKNVLFLAEGLLMYLEENEVIALLQKLATVFSNSELVFENVHKKYTQGFWKKVVESKMKRRTGSDAGAAYQFGLEKAEDIESASSSIKVLEEWSYFEDPDIKPGFQKLFKNLKTFSRTQWTIRVSLG